MSPGRAMRWSGRVMKRKHAALMGSASLVAATMFVFLSHSRSRISAENFEKIVVGMTEAEVLDILGMPPAPPANRASYVVFGSHKRRPSHTTEWFTPTYCILVFWDDARLVERKLEDVPSMAADPVLSRW